MCMSQKRAAAVAVATIAALISVGCATPTEIKSEAPKFVIESNRDAKTTAACITDKMVAKYHRLGNTVTSRVTQGGYVVQYDYVSPFGGATGMVIDVLDAPNGKARSSAHFDSGIRSYFLQDAEDATRECSK